MKIAESRRVQLRRRSRSSRSGSEGLITAPLKTKKILGVLSFPAEDRTRPEALPIILSPSPSRVRLCAMRSRGSPEFPSGALLIGSSGPKKIEVLGDNSVFVGGEVSFSAHLSHPGTPFGTIVISRVIELVAAGALLFVKPPPFLQVRWRKSRGSGKIGLGGAI